MSVDLSLELRQPVDVVLLRTAIGTALRSLLGLAREPVITAEEYQQQVRLPLQSSFIEADSTPILFGIEGEPEVVAVGPCKVGYEGKTYVYINVASERSALEHALAVATAVAIGRQIGSNVLDDSGYYTGGLELSADELASSLRVPDSCDDYRASAKVFYASLPNAPATAEGR